MIYIIYDSKKRKRVDLCVCGFLFCLSGLKEIALTVHLCMLSCIISQDNYHQLVLSIPFNPER